MTNLIFDRWPVNNATADPKLVDVAFWTRFGQDILLELAHVDLVEMAKALSSGKAEEHVNALVHTHARLGPRAALILVEQSIPALRDLVAEKAIAPESLAKIGRAFLEAARTAEQAIQQTGAPRPKLESVA